MSERRSLLRELPAIDKILASPLLDELQGQQPHVLIREAAQEAVEWLRRQILDEQSPLPEIDLNTVAAKVVKMVIEKSQPSLKRVINVTGTVLHTNLGRAPLSQEAIQAISEVAQGYSNLEYELDQGVRGKRFTHVEEILCKLTGGEAATVVNNNAGAVMLSLAALAGGKSALVSRGELIEIGGSFRIPDIMAASGVRLVEVGTTNKTHLTDYEGALTPETSLVLKVHTSNYRILGFTHAVESQELVRFAHENQMYVLEDLGSGLLIDLSGHGLPKEPTVRESLSKGIDIVTFSGDKLLGGPQAGMIVGKKDAVDKIRKHPMARALRIDKLTLAALEATLRLYLEPKKAFSSIPSLQMLCLPAEELAHRCEKLLADWHQALGGLSELEIIPTHSTVGGGALPLAELPGWAISLQPKHISLNDLAVRLRQGSPPVIGRIQDDRYIIDPRTLNREDNNLLASLLKQALKQDRS